MRHMHHFRRMLKFLRACLLRRTGLIWLAKRELRLSRAVPVLTFHRIVDDEEFAVSSSLPGILVRKRTFDNLTAWIARPAGTSRLGLSESLLRSTTGGWIITNTPLPSPYATA